MCLAGFYELPSRVFACGNVLFILAFPEMPNSARAPFFSGAPDPTAGGSLQEAAAWYLDEAGVREQLRVELANLANGGTFAFSGLGARSGSGRLSPTLLPHSAQQSAASVRPALVSTAQSNSQSATDQTASNNAGAAATAAGDCCD